MLDGSWLRAALLASAVVALQACSVPKLAYNNADWLILERIDDYVSLTHTQRGPLTTSLAQKLEAHRRNELPDIAQALERGAQVVRDGLDTESAEWMHDTVLGLGRRSIGRFVPTLAITLAELDDDQREFLRNELTTRNRKFAQESKVNGDPEERLKRRVERSVDRLEEVLGRLTEAQIDQVRTALVNTPDSLPLWLEHSRSRHEELMALLERGATAAQIETYLRDAYVELSNLPGPLRSGRDQARAMRVRLLVTLDGTLSAAQREHAVIRIEGLAEDARALIAQSS